MEITETTTAERRVAESITGPQLPAPAVKACFFVGELADRWQVHPESIRRLIREKKLKTLSGFRPYRITFDEVRRYECLDEAEEMRNEYLARRKGGRR